MEVVFSMIHGINDNCRKIKEVNKKTNIMILDIFLLALSVYFIADKMKNQEDKIENLKLELEEMKSKGE